MRGKSVLQQTKQNCFSATNISKLTPGNDLPLRDPGEPLVPRPYSTIFAQIVVQSMLNGPSWYS